jgi:hypothetical protein
VWSSILNSNTCFARANLFEDLAGRSAKKGSPWGLFGLGVARRSHGDSFILRVPEGSKGSHGGTPERVS